MKLSVITILGTVGSALAFAPGSVTERTTIAMNAEVPSQSRKAFIGTVAATLLASVPVVANAGTMSQQLILDKTEQWETGRPGAEARAQRNERFKNARNQNNSNFAPIKRLTLERKSPVERLDINAPNFSKYKDTYPGLYKTGAPAAAAPAATATAAAPAAAAPAAAAPAAATDAA